MTNYEIQLRFYVVSSSSFNRYIIVRDTSTTEFEFLTWSEKVNASLIFISRAFFSINDWTFVSAEEKRKKNWIEKKEFFYSWNSSQEAMNEKTTIETRIEFVDEAKFTDSSSENEIHER